jgi:nucleotide-binding universal stress UspA family protein
MKHIRRVLFATDLSPASRRAFTAALRVSQAVGAQLTIVHVIGPVSPTVPEQYIDGLTLELLRKQSRDWSARQLRKLADRASRSGIRARVLLLDGDPVAQIARGARSQHADLIIVGTHGRRGLTKFVLGSVAGRVITTAPCPVMTVRG